MIYGTNAQTFTSEVRTLNSRSDRAFNSSQNEVPTENDTPGYTDPRNRSTTTEN